jgi:hypothetical protein
VDPNAEDEQTQVLLEKSPKTTCPQHLKQHGKGMTPVHSLSSCRVHVKKSTSGAGMVVRKRFCIAFAFALFVKAHCIALHFFASHFLFAFASHFTHVFSSHFRTFSTFLVNISRLMHQKL